MPSSKTGTRLSLRPMGDPSTLTDAKRIRLEATSGMGSRFPPSSVMGGATKSRPPARYILAPSSQESTPRLAGEWELQFFRESSSGQVLCEGLICEVGRCREGQALPLGTCDQSAAWRQRIRQKQASCPVSRGAQGRPDYRTMLRLVSGLLPLEEGWTVWKQRGEQHQRLLEGTHPIPSFPLST